MSEEINEESLPPTKRQKLDNGSEQIATEDASDRISEIDFTEDVTQTDNTKFSVSDDKYNNFVSPEELEKLREFKVLDEIKSNDEDSDNDESQSSDGKSEVPEEEIEKMLEEDLPDDFKGAPKPKVKPYTTTQKIVLEEKGVNHFEVLPLDWMMIRHYSGMPVYMHRTTRVCTLSKPYFLGKGNTRRHDIPISAIPCLAYRRALEEEEKQKEIDRKIEEQIKNGTWKKNIDKNKINKDNNKINNADNNKEVDNDRNEANKEVNNEKTLQDSKESSDQDAVPNEISNETGAKTKCPFNHGNTVQDNAEGNKTNEGKTNGDASSEDKTNGENEDIPLNMQPVVLPGGIVMPPPRVETVNTSWKAQHLTYEQVNDYCKKLFKFKTVNIMQFVSWAERRKYTKARKALQCPTLPKGTKLITIPAQSSGQDNADGKNKKRDWVMNMNECSYLSVFHEYVRRALDKQPVYEFKQLENAATPYQATVYIGGMQYGVGHGSSKRQAKSAAARASIHILIPEMKDKLEPRTDNAEPDFSFFDYVGIEDPRITEFCAATCEPSPHAILRTCLLRNFGAGDRHIHTEMKKLEYQKIELTMKVGKHTATVVCKNKKTAKQRASQAILQALHPHVRSWGSLLRLYGSRSVKSCKEKKLEEQQITLLQDKARHNEPNYAVLEKLRYEMKKLRERDAAVVPIGTLLVKDDLPTHSGSNLNNVDL